MNEPYRYEALREPTAIRLIQIQPELLDGCIVCVINQYDDSTKIEPIPNYRALTYVWGDPKLTRTIYLGESTHNLHEHPIHENFWRFLSAMRQQERIDVPFWTDSLCLSQAHKGEIAHQISRMGTIYAEAERVFIWLGWEKESGNALKQIMAYNGDSLSDIASQGEPDARETAKAITCFMSLPYWSRVWIIQEFVNAPVAVIIAGTMVVDPDSLKHKLKRCGYLQGGPRGFWRLCEVRETKMDKSLWYLVQLFVTCESTYTIDKMYGFMGLASDLVDPSKIEINTQKRPFEAF